MKVTNHLRADIANNNSGLQFERLRISQWHNESLDSVLLPFHDELSKHRTINYISIDPITSNFTVTHACVAV